MELITKELDVMVGMKLFMDDLKAAYLESSIMIDQTYWKQLIALQEQLHRLKKEYSFERESHRFSIETSIFLGKQGMKYLKRIVALKAELLQFKSQVI